MEAEFLVLVILLQTYTSEVAVGMRSVAPDMMDPTMPLARLEVGLFR
jgi:hypothetical protein